MKRIIAIALAATVALSLSACSNDTLSTQYKSGDNKNYIAGDGTVSEFAKSSRKPAVAWSGTTESGVSLSSAQLSGVVVVMNFWYAGCAPCRAEAKDLVALNKKYANQKIQFVGVNVRDTADTTIAFDRTFSINWPSILDSSTGSVLLAFTGVVSPQAVPTTLVIDKQGKVAGRILGRFEKGILDAMIQRVVTE